MNLGKVGFIMCGGGFSGSYSAGFLKAITEKGVKPDFVQGVSAGALNGYKYVEAGCDVEPLIKKWLEVQKLGKSEFFNWRDVIKRLNKPSVYSNEPFLKHLIQKMDVKALAASPIEFQIVTINETKSRRIIFSNKSEEIQKDPELLKNAVLTSISIPGLLPPILINGEWYSDGQAPKLKEAIKAKCDTVFVFANHKFVTLEPDSGKWNWTHRLAYGLWMSNDSWVVKEIKYLVEHGYTLIENSPSSVFDDIRPLHKVVKRKIKKIVDGVTGAMSADNLEDAGHALMPHRIVVLTPPKPITTLYTVGFNQANPKAHYPGDISSAIEQCHAALDAEFWDKLS